MHDVVRCSKNPSCTFSPLSLSLSLSSIRAIIIENSPFAPSLVYDGVRLVVRGELGGQSDNSRALIGHPSRPHACNISRYDECKLSFARIEYGGDARRWHRRTRRGNRLSLDITHYRPREQY